MPADSVVVLSARRSPIGAFQGVFSDTGAIRLGTDAIAAALNDARVDPAAVDEVLMGCVLPAGLGQAPARQAAIAAGIATSVPCTTVNKMCGSGMKTIMQGYDAILAGSAEVVVAGGLESMTNAPYLLPRARGGYRMGHGQVLDHMFTDGLQDIYEGHMMGHYAQNTADRYGYTREQQDAFAIASVRRAQSAAAEGRFAAEIAPVIVATRQGEVTVGEDETPQTVSVDKIPTLRPAFRKDGTVTAASSSSIADGAAALVLASARYAEAKGLEPLARLVAHSSFAQDPEWFTTAPIAAIERLHRKLGWTPDKVDLYEINEAFAVVAMAAIQDAKLDADKVNVNGGACALGHPVGATGARITTTLIHELKARALKRGVASLCIGGGEATALGVEIV